MRAQPAAKPQFGVVPRLVGRHAGFSVVARSLLDMELQFGVDLGVKAAAAENVDQAFSPCHAYPRASCVAEDARDCLRQLSPVGFFLSQLLSACRSNRVVASTAIVLRRAPFRLQ